MTKLVIHGTDGLLSKLGPYAVKSGRFSHIEQPGWVAPSIRQSFDNPLHAMFRWKEKKGPVALPCLALIPQGRFMIDA